MKHLIQIFPLQLTHHIWDKAHIHWITLLNLLYFTILYMPVIEFSLHVSMILVLTYCLKTTVPLRRWEVWQVLLMYWAASNQYELSAHIAGQSFSDGLRSEWILINCTSARSSSELHFVSSLEHFLTWRDVLNCLEVLCDDDLSTFCYEVKADVVIIIQ